MTLAQRLAYATVVSAGLLLAGSCSGSAGLRDTSPAPTPSSSAPVLTAAPTPTEPTETPAPLARPLRDQSGPKTLDAGTYVLDYFPADLAFDIPEGSGPGWHVGMSTAEAAIVLWLTPPEFTYLFGFWNVDNVYVDPCNAAAGELDPPIGPSVDDLVAALSNLSAFEATAPVNVTVGAFRGKEIELTALDAGVSCPDVIAFSSGGDHTDVPAGQTLRLQILGVDGVRIAMTDRPWDHDPKQTDPTAEAELQQILNSIRIESLP